VSEATKDRLADIFPADRISTEDVDLQKHADDWSPGALLARRAGKLPQSPQAIVRPENTGQVSTLLEWAARTRTPVIPYGGGSGVLAGIRVESPEAIVVDLGDMWHIHDLDDRSRLVRVEAGVSGPQLTEALAVQGYLLGHEPQSIAISTVGGWIATRASGQLSARYGGIEDLLVSLEAVLPGGKVVRSKPAPRRAAGPDVAALMIGSEGTLGIVTEATLRISPLPVDRLDLCLRFGHMTDGVKAARAFAQSDLQPTMVRLYDAEDASLFLRHHPDEQPGPLMVCSFDGRDAARRAAEAAALAGGREGNPALVEHWWKHRNNAVHEFKSLMAGEGLLGPHGIVETMEVAGSWSVLRELYHSMKEELSGRADIVGCHLSHIYPDGACLYFTMGAVCENDDEATEKLEGWWDAGMEKCLSAGGSISHHHGIGRTKARWLEDESGGWFEVLQAVKKAIDPAGIMNPGALGL